MNKSVIVFPFSFLKIITIFFLLHKIQTPRHKHAKWLPSNFTPWTLTLTLTAPSLDNKVIFFNNKRSPYLVHAVSSYKSHS